MQSDTPAKATAKASQARTPELMPDLAKNSAAFIRFAAPCQGERF